MNKITFCISNGKNEKDHIKLLFQSLDRNLTTKDHEIIVFVDSDNQNTTEFLIGQKKKFPNLKVIKNPLSMAIGMQANLNYMFEIAENDIVSNLQSDMVICKDYDQLILSQLEEHSIVSATRIEPPLHPPGPEKIVYDLGVDPTTFSFKSFDEIVNKVKDPNKTGNYFFAPFTLYKQRWLEIGGHDTIFRRAREDSDIVWRLLLNGNQIKQNWNAFVYHFTCTSSRGPKWWTKQAEIQQRTEIQKQADQIEMRRFLRKWKEFRHPLTHDQAKHHIYRISANIRGVKPDHTQLILQMFYLFDKIYIDNPDVYKEVIKNYPSIHNPANFLHHTDDETWAKYQGIYRLENADQIYFNEPIQSENVVVSFHLDNFGQEVQEAAVKMNDILHESLTDGDTGEFEVNGINVQVYSLKNEILKNIYVKNPSLNQVDLITL